MSVVDLSPIDLASEPAFRLGPHVVHPSTREIATGAERMTLEPRVMQVLVALAQHQGQTVSRDRLIARCWGGVAVGEDSIQRCIGRLRRVAEKTRAFEIITLSRVGYRLNVAQDSGRRVAPERLLAVLPFDNLSNDPNFDHFVEGVAEEILHAIARRSSIKVIGRTSSFQFRGQDKVVARIAQELGVTHILDGSVRRSGDRLRVAAHLMEVAEQELLWSDRFDGGLDNPFALQDEVAHGAIQALSGALGETVPGTLNSGAAFDVLLKLRQVLHTKSFGGEVEAVVASVEQFTPQSAEAWGMVARVRASQRWAERARERELREAAREAAERALRIDPNCGAAHRALFLIEPLAGRFLEREERLERARTANPEDGELLWSLYVHYLSVGRVKRSVQMAEEAYRIDPLRPRNVIAYANSLYTAGLPKQSLALMRHAVDRWPHDATVFAITVWTAAVDGEHEFARELLRGNWRERYTASSYTLIERAVYAAQGILQDPDRLREDARIRLTNAVGAGGIEIALAGLLGFLGMDLDALYDVIDRMPLEKLRDPGAAPGPLDGLSHLFLRVNQRLRQSPRFAQLCARLGLVDYWQASNQWPDCVDEVAPYYDFLNGLRVSSRSHA